jgi:hypothetical protein
MEPVTEAHDRIFLGWLRSINRASDGGYARPMKKHIQNFWLGADVLGLVLAHLKAGLNCWMRTLCIPFDVLFLLQYSQIWVREQFRESQCGSWQKDVNQ